MSAILKSLVDMYLYTLHIFHDMFSIIWLVVNCNGHLDRDLNDDDTIQTELLYQANTVSKEKGVMTKHKNTIDIPCFLYQKTLVI